MTDQSKKVSQLPIVSTSVGTDRVVILTNPATNAALKTITVANLVSNLPYANSTAGGVVRIGNNISIDIFGAISAGTGVPSTNGAAVGYVLTTNSSGNAVWQQFGGVFNVVTIDSANSYTVTSNDSVILVNPAVANSDVTITLPVANAIEGKEILIKIIDKGNNFRVKVQTDDLGNAYLEDPVTGAFNYNYYLVDSGQAETWIHDGNVYRHLNTARATPIFYTNANTYAQVVVKNQSAGNNSSADVALYNNLGNSAAGTGPFIDIGIDGSNYSNSFYTLYGPSDGYVYVDNNGNPGGNLIIGTAGDRSIVFHANGTQTNNKVFTVNSTVITSGKSILPTSNNLYSLGNSTNRWESLWVGGNSVTFSDQTPGYPDQTLTVANGVFYITDSLNTKSQSNAGLQVGNFLLQNNSIVISNTSANINIGNTGSTGAINFKRKINVRNSTDEWNLLSVDPEGRVDVISEIVTNPANAALSVTSSRTRSINPPNNPGVLLQLSGSSTAPSRLYNDSYGANNYSAFIGRHARGPSEAPTQTLAGDTIARFGANPYGTDGFAAISTARVDIVNREDQTATNKGSEIQLWTTANGSATISKRLTVNEDGVRINSGNVVFSDGSIQNTAFNSSSAVTKINVGAGLTQSGNVGIVGIDSTAVLSVAGTANQVSVSNVGGNYTLSLPQNISSTSNVQFNTLTVTNLTVTGTSSVAANATIANSVLNLAYNSTNSSQIDTGGITLGNTSSAYYVSIKYNLSNNAWTTGNTNLITKNLTANAITSNTGWFTGQLHAGAGYVSYDFPNATFQGDCNNNSYNQVVIQNHNNGTQASSDFVAVNDIGTDSANYIDMGINSSTYANNDYSMGGPNDGYLYVNGGNLDIATQTAGKDIQFFTGNTTIGSLRATINAIGLAVTGNVSGSYFIGNALTANTTSYVGTVSAANVVSNAQLVANLANYVTTAGLSANVATLTSNNTSFVGTVSAANVVSNAQLVANLANYVSSSALNNYQTTAGLSANVATLTANNTSFVGTVTAANVVSNAQLVANLANYQLITNMSFYQTTTGLASNVATLTANNANTVNYVGTVTAANVVSNAQLQANLGNYVLSSTLSASLAGYQTAAGLAANVVTLTSNNTNYVGTIAAANVVSNAQLASVLANYTNTSGITSLISGSTANNTNYVGSVAAANVVSNTQLLANLANYQSLSGLNANVAALGYVNNTGSFTMGGVITHNANLVINTTSGISANGSVGTNGQILTSNGSSVYWKTHVPDTSLFILNADRALTNQTALQSALGVGITLNSSTRYRYRFIAAVYKSSATGTYALTYGLGGTATPSLHFFMVNPCDGATQETPTATLQMSARRTANFSTATTITGTNTGTTWYSIIVDGIIDITTGGTMIPEIGFTGTPGSSSLIQQGASFEIWPIGSTGANTNIGGWA